MHRAWRSVLAVTLAAEQEIGAREHHANGAADTGVEAAALSAGVVEVEQQLEVLLRYRPSVREVRELGEDFRRAGRLVARVLGIALEDPLAARSVAQALHIQRPRAECVVHGRQAV